VAQPYSDQVKAAVLAALLSGQSLRSVAQHSGVSRRTITAWRDASQLTGSALVAPQKKQAIGEQVYGLMEETIEALRAQLRATSDEVWIKRQSAADLAIFHGVLSDKCTRLLAAFRPEHVDSD